MTSAISSTTVAKLLAALAVLAVPSLAHAQTRADVLFKEGRALLDQKRFDEACPQLAESQKLEPGAGTLLALALCHEGQGRNAAAHRELEEASKLGLRNGRGDLANAAQKRARAMEAKLSRLVVRTKEPLELRCDGESVEADKTQFLDAGEHRIEASSPGKIAKSYVVRLSGAGVSEIVIDKLEAEPIAAAAPTIDAPRVVLMNEPPAADGHAATSSSGRAQKIIGLSIAAIGVGGLGTGVYFGSQAFKDSADARRTTGTASTDARDKSRRAFTSTAISLAAGTGALTLGLVLFATAPKSTKTTARIVPTGGPGDVGMGMAGIF